MDDLAERLESAADMLTTVDRSVPALEVPAGAFAATGIGTPGRVGRQLHAHWRAVLGARAREAADVATRLSEMAEALRTTQRAYADADEAVARRVGREA
jgi:excreted virulence factor EspC (type VII ESX diderm)